jgi:hypothetical protein
MNLSYIMAFLIIVIPTESIAPDTVQLSRAEFGLNGFRAFRELPLGDLSRENNDAWVESIPVEDRLEVIDAILERRDRKTIHQESLADRRTDEMKAYAQYIESSLYVDFGVLDLMRLYATGRDVPIQSAAGMAEIVRIHTGSLHSPQRILEWYNLFLSRDNKMFCDRQKRGKLSSSDKLWFNVWQWKSQILEVRKKRLLDTGYETF